MPKKIISSEVQSDTFIEKGTDPTMTQAAEVREVITNSLVPSIDTDNPFNEQSLYKSTRKKIIDDYNA